MKSWFHHGISGFVDLDWLDRLSLVIWKQPKWETNIFKILQLWNKYESKNRPFRLKNLTQIKVFVSKNNTFFLKMRPRKFSEIIPNQGQWRHSYSKLTKNNRNWKILSVSYKSGFFWIAKNRLDRYFCTFQCNNPSQNTFLAKSKSIHFNIIFPLNSRHRFASATETVGLN